MMFDFRTAKVASELRWSLLNDAYDALQQALDDLATNHEYDLPGGFGAAAEDCDDLRDTILDIAVDGTPRALLDRERERLETELDLFGGIGTLLEEGELQANEKSTIRKLKRASAAFEIVWKMVERRLEQ